jgi:hypothetical protein
MMMRSSFTTLIAVLLAASLSPATAQTAFTFTDFVVGIERVDWIPADCTPAVITEIDEVIRDCVEFATGLRKDLPYRNNRRRAEVAIDDTPRDESRHRQLTECSCLAHHIVDPLCTWTCSNGCQERRRRVEEQPEFLGEGDGKRELTQDDNVLILAHCGPQLKQYAKDKTTTHRCLGDDKLMEIEILTFDIA